MAKAPNLILNLDTKGATKRIKKAEIAANKLKAALDKLRDLEIGYEVVEIKRKWWQFWK